MDAGYWNESQAAARARGLTQDALAGMLHVTRQTVSSWEIGRTEPDLDTLLALAEALHCDATELIYGVKRNGYQQYQRRWIVCSMVCGVLVTLLVFCWCSSRRWRRGKA